MDILKFVPGDRIYFDTNIWIYALEGYADYMPVLTALFSQVDAGNLKVITSELTLAEALVKPFVDQNAARQQTYQRVLQNSEHLQVIPITRSILVQAAKLRATESDLKLPDAIHLTTALFSHCDVFLTNDKRIRSVANLQVLQLAQMVDKLFPFSE